MKALLLSVLVWCWGAEAQIRVSVRWESSIPRALAMEFARSAATSIRDETGLRIRVVRGGAVSVPSLLGYPSGAAAFYRDLLKPKQRTVLLVPVFGYAGQAPICGDFVVSSVIPWAFGYRPYPDSYRAGVVNTLTHEMGHMFGATHTKNGSVMDYGGSGLGFGSSSVEEMYRCLS